MQPVVTKVCRDCTQCLSLELFVKSKAFKQSGYDNICKVCNYTKTREYRRNKKPDRSQEYKKYREKYPEKVSANSGTRRAKKRQRVPKWLSLEEQWMINEVYSLARLRTKLTGIKWHVDHIIPLVSNTVSGLHTITNLQVIPAKLNLIKGNSYGSTTKHWTTRPTDATSRY